MLKEIPVNLLKMKLLSFIQIGCILSVCLFTLTTQAQAGPYDLEIGNATNVTIDVINRGVKMEPYYTSFKTRLYDSRLIPPQTTVVLKNFLKQGYNVVSILSPCSSGQNKTTGVGDAGDRVVKATPQSRTKRIEIYHQDFGMSYMTERPRCAKSRDKRYSSQNGFDLSGRWVFGQNGEYWTFRKTGRNTYNAREHGFGNAYGTATVEGTRFTIRYQCPNNRCRGSYSGTIYPDRMMIRATRSDGQQFVFRRQ